MKKKYLLNGKVYDESTLLTFAQKSNLTFEEYLKESGAVEHTEVNTYELNGKTYDENTIKVYADKSGLSLNDYLKEAGVKKKETTGGLLSTGGENTDQSLIPSTPKNNYPQVLEIAKNVYPDKADQIYNQFLEAIDSQDSVKITEANDMLKKMGVLSATKNNALTSEDRAEIKKITGVDDQKLQEEKLYELQKSAAGLFIKNQRRKEFGDDSPAVWELPIPIEQFSKVGTYLNKLRQINNEVSDKWVDREILVQGGKNITEYEELVQTLGGLGGNALVRIGTKLTGRERKINNETINLSLSTGIEALKNIDPVKYKRITDDITNGKRLASSDVVELTASGAKIRQAKNVQNLWDDNIGINTFTNVEEDYGKEAEKNIYSHPDYLRTMIADVVGKHYEKDRIGALWSKWMVSDKEIDAVPQSEFIAAGLDPTNPEFKKQLNFIKSSESWMPFMNAISKDDIFREFKKGAMTVPAGIASTLESMNPLVSNEDEEIDKRTQVFNVANVANQRGKYFQDNYGIWADAFQGFGQFSSQLALMFAGSGGAAATGEILGGGTTASNLLNATRLQRLGNTLIQNRNLYGTYGTSFVMSYGDYYKDALSKGADPLTAKMMAFTNASMEGVSETLFDNIEFAKKVGRNLTSKENFERVAKIFDKGVLDDVTAKAYKENLQLAVAKALGESALGLTKEAFEEVPVALTNFVVDAAMNPASVSGRDMLGEAKDAFLNGLVSFSIPSIFGIVGNLNKESNSLDRKPAESLMISTLQAPYVVDAINRLKDSGEITEQEANQKIKVINTATNQFMLMPRKNSNDEQLTWKEKEDYLTLSVRQKFLEQKIKEDGDEAAAAVYQKQVQDILEQKKNILKIKENETKVQSVPTPANEKKEVKKGEETLIDKIRSEISKPKNESEDEKLRVASYEKAPDKDFEYIIDQSVDAPARTLEVLNNNKEILTDAISQKSEEEINQSIKSWQNKAIESPDLDEDAQGKILKEVKDNLTLLREGLAKKQAASKPSELTPEAKEFLNKLGDGVPTFISKNLQKIADENGIKVTPQTKASDIVTQLREKAGIKTKSQPKQAEIKFDEVAEAIPEENKNDFNKLTSDVADITEKLKTEQDAKAIADLMNQRNELYKKIRGSLGQVEKPNQKVRVSSRLLEIADDFGVSVEDAAEIDKIADESETEEEYSTKLNEFLADKRQLDVSESEPTVKNIDFGEKYVRENKDGSGPQEVKKSGKGEGFEDVLAATKHFEMDELSAFNGPLNTRLNKASVDMAKDGRVKWYWTTEDQRSDKLGVEMFDDPNGREVTRRETLYDILTGDGYSERQRGMAAAYILANRLVQPYGSRDNLNNFNSRLFDKAGGKVTIFYSENENSQMLAAGPDGTIAINAAKLGRRLSEYIRNGGGEKTFLTWAEVALNEEVLHLATFKVATKAELEKIYDEMSPQEREVVSHIYQSNFKNDKGEVNKAAIAGEYIRMVTQERILGRFANENRTGTITEMFKPGMEKSKPAPGQKNGLRTFFAKLTAWMTKVFKDTKSKTAKDVIQRLNDYIAGKPLQAEVVTEAVVKQPNVMAVQYAGKEQFIENRDGAYHLVERDANGKYVDKVDPLKGTSLIGFSVGEAQDAIKMSSDMLGASQSERGQIGVNKQQLLLLLGPTMYNKPLAQVAVKELMQNSFDGVKARQNITDNKGSGSIDIKIDKKNRTISIKDDGIGMTPDIVKNAFLSIGGTNKEGLDVSERSGGFGLAKVQFLLGSEKVKVITVRDGTKTSIEATNIQLYNDDFEIKTESTNEPNGTFVEVKIPENYTTPEGVKRDIEFPWAVNRIDALQHPLIGDVNVSMDFNGKKETLPLGNNVELPPLFSKIKFSWGDAELYMSEDKVEDRWSAKHQILSSGIYQFDKAFTNKDHDKIPYDIVVNIKPKVSSTSEQYPFNNQREDFKNTVRKDIEALSSYLSSYASGEAEKEAVGVYQKLQPLPKTDPNKILSPEEREKLYADIDKTVAEARRLRMEMSSRDDGRKKVSNIVIREGMAEDVDTGESYSKEKEYEKSFEAERKIDRNAAVDIKEFDPSVPQFHNNTNFNYLEIPGAIDFFSDFGTVVLDLVRFAGDQFGYDYKKLKSEDRKFFTGVSIDKGYGGVHIRKIIDAIFINPLYFDVESAEEAVGVGFHVILHEINHTTASGEGANFTGDLAKLYGKIYSSGKYGYYEGLLRSVYKNHFETYKNLKHEYDKSSTRNVSESFEGSEIKAGDTGSVQGNEGDVRTGQDTGQAGNQGDGENNQGASGTDRTGEVIGSFLDNQFSLGASQGARGESFIENISKRVGALELEDILKTAEAKIKDVEGDSTSRIGNIEGKTTDLIFGGYRKMLKDGASDNDIFETIADLYAGYPKETTESLRDLNIINNEEAEVLLSQSDEEVKFDDTDTLLISQLGFQLNASQGMDEKAKKLWEEKQREKLDKKTAKVAKDIKDGKTTYQDAVAGQTDEYIESLAAQINPTLHNDEFRNYVRRLRDAGYTSQQIKDDLGIRKRLTKAENDIIDDEFTNTYENDPAIKALREALTELQDGRRPKSVLKTLLSSRISDIVKTLKDFAYDKVSNKELEAMVDQLLSNINLKDAEKFIATMDSTGLSDMKQMFRAKVVIALKNQNFAGAKAMAKRLVSDMATDATVAGRQTQTLRRVYELFHAYGSPEMKSNFARQYAESVNKKAEQKIATVLKDVKRYKEETEKLNDEIHQEAIDTILDSELQKNKLQSELDKICNRRTRKRK